MKYFVLSDIHGNLQALLAVLAWIRGIGYDRCICLGDVVGYGADPVKCWEKISQIGNVIIRGNHEDAIICGVDDHYSYIASCSLLWTIDQLIPHPKITAAMQALPLTWVESGLRFVHASPNDPERFIYVKSEALVAQSINAFDETVCFIGHTHRPWYAVVDARTHQSTITCNITYGEKIQLTPEMRCLVNVGSVGQPRDGNPNARFVIYDTDELTLTFHEVPYNIAGAQRVLRQSTLDPQVAKFLAARLATAE